MLCTFEGEFVVIEQISGHEGFGLNPAMFAWNGAIAYVVMIDIG